MKMTRRKEKSNILFTEGPLLKKMILFSIPILVAGILQLFYNSADSMIVGKFSGDENVLPTRADIAEIYKFFRRENMSGHTSFTYRMLRSRLFEYSHMAVNYAKLRFVISILGDIRVCGIAEETDKTVSIEVYKNAAKTNIELSETYKKLREQCIC